jgi:hypothetical protein
MLACSRLSCPVPQISVLICERERTVLDQITDPVADRVDGFLPERRVALRPGVRKLRRNAIVQPWLPSGLFRVPHRRQDLKAPTERDNPDYAPRSAQQKASRDVNLRRRRPVLGPLSTIPLGNVHRSISEDFSITLLDQGQLSPRFCSTPQ